MRRWSAPIPGATPLEVEQLVTEPIEREVQSMRLVHKITSESYYGLSKVHGRTRPCDPCFARYPQLWDELRRKVLNIQPRLPAGASPVTVADDFGDVYGIYYGLSVDGGFHLVGAARLGAADQDGARDGRRRAEGDAFSASRRPS